MTSLEVSPLVLAHIGHWLIGAAFAAPALILPLVLVGLAVRDRRSSIAD